MLLVTLLFYFISISLLRAPQYWSLAHFKTWQEQLAITIATSSKCAILGLTPPAFLLIPWVPELRVLSRLLKAQGSWSLCHAFPGCERDCPLCLFGNLHAASSLMEEVILMVSWRPVPGKWKQGRGEEVLSHTHGPCKVCTSSYFASHSFSHLPVLCSAKACSLYCELEHLHNM